MGGLRRITLFELPTDPAPHADQCQIYAKDDSGRTELFFMDQSGATTQITKDGYLDVQYEADVLGLPYELVDPVSGESKGSIYTKKINGNVELFYIDSLGNVIQLTENGSIKEDAILADATYYVDGDSGSDSNDGLSWGAAKKTFAFLYSGDSDAIPRELKAEVTIKCRGTILAKTFDRHTFLDNFYGSGKISIEGEYQDVITGQTPTGWDNTISSVEYHSYLEVSSATYGVDDYQGMFIQFTSPSSNVMYPVLSNTITRIETTGLPDLVGTETFKIVCLLTNFRPSTVSDPGTIITSLEINILRTDNCQIALDLSGVKILIGSTNFGSSLTAANNYDISYVPSTILNCVICGFYTYCPGISFISCSLGTKHSSSNNITTWDSTKKLLLNRCIFPGSLTFDYGALVTYSPLDLSISSSRISNYYYGIYCESYIFISPFENNLIEGCTIGINLNNSAVDHYSGYVRFKNNGKAINLQNTTMKIARPNSIAGFYGSGNTHDIVISDNPYFVSKVFADVENSIEIYNTKMGGKIIYYKDNALYGTYSFTEYLNNTSGLDGYSYQEAIDELASVKSQKSSGTASPNGIVSGNIGDIYVDTLYDISYINIDGTNTGWRVM